PPTYQKHKKITQITLKLINLKLKTQIKKQPNTLIKLTHLILQNHNKIKQQIKNKQIHNQTTNTFNQTILHPHNKQTFNKNITILNTF
ncbi:hypothetical protein DF186_18225, partial [Enterococcus hirae]